MLADAYTNDEGNLANAAYQLVKELTTPLWRLIVTRVRTHPPVLRITQAVKAAVADEHASTLADKALADALVRETGIGYNVAKGWLVDNEDQPGEEGNEDVS